MPTYNNITALFLLFHHLKNLIKVENKRWQILIKSFLLFNYYEFENSNQFLGKATESKTIWGFRSRDNGCGNIEGG